MMLKLLVISFCLYISGFKMKLHNSKCSILKSRGSSFCLLHLKRSVFVLVPSKCLQAPDKAVISRVY